RHGMAPFEDKPYGASPRPASRGLRSKPVPPCLKPGRLDHRPASEPPKDPNLRPILLFLAAMFAAMTGAVPARAEPADIAAAARSVVRIVLISKDFFGQPSMVGHGSGVAIGPNLILTNAHVVQDAQNNDSMRIGVVPPEGKTGWFA